MAYIGSKPADAVLETDDITDGVITTSKLADNSVTTAKTSYSDIPHRNIIINGDMSIAQRGTSETGVNTTGYYTVDRFKLTNASAGTWTQSQSTDVPTGQGFATSLKMDCTTADASPSSGDVLILQQLIEGQNLQYLKKGTANAESLTLSFWVKSNKTGTYICELRDVDNNRTISKSYTISSANTWEKKTITFDGDTTGAFGNDNAESLRCSFYLNAGSDYTSGTLQTSWSGRTNANRAVGQVNLADSTSNEWYVTGIQLEAGTSASDFDFLPVDVNFNRCLRYFQNITGPINMHQTSVSDQAILHFALQQNMRTTPTMAVANQTANVGVFGGNNDATSPSISANKSTSSYGCGEYEHGQNFHSDSAGEGQILIYNDGGTVFLTMASEL